MERRSLLKAGVAAVALGPTAGPLAQALAQLAPRLVGHGWSAPHHVGLSDIERLRGLAAAYESHGMISGGGATDARGELLKAALAHVGEAQSMLVRSQCPEALQSDLYCAAAWLMRAAGFAAFDIGAYPLADDLLGAALQLADDSGNPSIRARVAGTRARMKSWLGDQQTAVLLVRSSLRTGGLVATERAMLHSLHARALGRMGKVAETREAIDLADIAIDQIEPGEMNTRPWAVFFNRADQQGDTGRALLDLSAATKQATHVPEAMARHQTAANGHDATTRRRSSALTLVSLAVGDVLQGAPDLALRHGHAALSLTHGSLESRRVYDELRGLRSMCQDRCAGNRHATELAGAIDLALIA